MTSLAGLPAREIARLVRTRETSAEEVCRAHLARAEQARTRLGAFLHLDSEALLASARALDAARADGPLAGVPIAIKDNICVRGVPTTCASKILQGWVPPYDATVIERLARAGALPFGKTNCDEFAMGSSNENSAYGPVRNPWALDRVPGGSSGGSAAAVAFRAAPAGLGSDTGGSIRQPASLCGVVGLKPTYGRVSRYGLVAFASSLDQIGPLTRDVADAAVVLQAIAGHDPHDSTSAPEPVPDLSAQAPARFRFGVPPEALGAGVSADVRAAMERALQALEAAGGERVAVTLPHSEAAVAVYYVVATAEASSNLARYDGVRYGHRAQDPADVLDMIMRTRAEGFGPEVRRRILLGTYVLSSGYYDAYYRSANRVRTLIAQDFDTAFSACDVVVTPTSPTVAFRLGERVADPLAMYLSDVFTVPANLAGIPGISLPCGVGDGGLPVGVQLLAPAFAEPRLLALAARLEGELRFAATHPLPD